MKKMILLIVAGIILFAFIFGMSVLWYDFFYKEPVENEPLTTIKIQLDDNNNTINEGGLIPISEDEVDNLTPYKFSLQNTSDKQSTYEVLIEDAVISDDPSFSSKELLSREQLGYQLILNGQIIKTGLLSEIENNVLDKRVIMENAINNYHLRVYVSESAINTEWQKKYYHYDIQIRTVEDNE